MALDDTLREIFTKGGRILVVDNLCESHEYMQHKDALEAFTMQHEVDVQVDEITHERLRFASEAHTADLEEYDLILVNSNVTKVFQAAIQLANSASSVQRVRDLSPETPLIYTVPEYAKPTNAALNQVMSLFSLDARFLQEPVDGERHPSLMHFLYEKVTGRIQGSSQALSVLQHDTKNSMWDSYIPFIDESLRAGNSQTTMDYQFLILSNKRRQMLGEYTIHAAEKVKVKAATYELKQNDVEKTAAIFVDNEWNQFVHKGKLGDGIHTLRRIREDMDARGVNIPIIYQSGHNLEDFSREEQEEIKSLGAVLAAKDIFPKVCQGRLKAEKEREIGKVVTRNPNLSKYVATIYDFGRDLTAGEDLFVLCSQMVSSSVDGDSEKDKLFAKLQIEDTQLNHRMYVLSMLHTELQSEVENPILASRSVEYSKPYAVIRDALNSNRQFTELGGQITENLYESIRQEHELDLENASTLIHNDTKWDNWFGGSVLGDCSDMCAGHESKDIAKAMFDPENEFSHVKDVSYVEEVVGNYLRMREDAQESEYKELVHKVKEQIFLESLRLARFKYEKRDPEGVVAGLLEVAKVYRDHLLQAR